MKHYGKDFKSFFKYKSNNIAPTKGRVLIAEPLLQGKHFSRSVILLTEHDGNGSMGFVLNKPLLLNVNDLVDVFPTCKSPLFLGGPVNTDHLFFIHTVGHLIPHSRPLGANLFFSGDFLSVRKLLENELITPQQIRFFSGYAGWGLGQLQDEIEEKSWIVSLLSTETIMKTNTENLWQIAVSELGNSYRHWLNFPKNPQHN